MEARNNQTFCDFLANFTGNFKSRPGCIFKEHEEICKLSESEKRKLIEAGIPEKENCSNISTLGIHIDGLSLKTYYYVGCTWLSLQNNRYIVKVLPKFPKTSRHKWFDLGVIIQILLDEICKNERIMSHMLNNLDKIFYFSLSDPLIDVGEEENNLFNLITVFSFLSLLKILVNKGLKKDYRTKYINRIKGKILVEETWNKYHSKGRIDKVVSQYITLTHECYENSLIKVALNKIRKDFLGKSNQIESDQTERLLSEIKTLWRYFQDIPEDLYLNKSFRKLKPNKFYREYNLILKLAYIIVKNIGRVPSSLNPNNHSHAKVVPFAINMPYLYELYVWSRLSQECKGCKIYYQYKAGHDRLDFLIKCNEKIKIVEVKYTYNPSKNILINNISQLARYNINENINKKFPSSNPEKDLILVYPSLKRDEDIKKLEESYPVEFKEIPIISESKNQSK